MNQNETKSGGDGDVPQWMSTRKQFSDDNDRYEIPEPDGMDPIKKGCLVFVQIKVGCWLLIISLMLALIALERLGCRISK